MTAVSEQADTSIDYWRERAELAEKKLRILMENLKVWDNELQKEGQNELDS